MSAEQVDRKPVIGVIDSQNIWQGVLTKALSSQHETVVFSSIRKAESYIKSGQQPIPDAFLVGMRRTNILSTVRLANALAKREPAVPVVVYTSVEDPDIQERVSSEGHVQGYLTQPFSLEELHTTVTAALQHKHE